MTKKLLIPLSLALLATVTTVEANYDSSLRICEYVQANDKQRLRKFLKTKKIKIRKVYDGVKCNKDNLLVFAAKSKALDVGDFIIGKLPSKVVASEVENIAQHSPHLAAVAQDRVK